MPSLEYLSSRRSPIVLDVTPDGVKCLLPSKDPVVQRRTIGGAPPVMAHHTRPRPGQSIGGH